MIKCKICGKECSSNKGLAIHLKRHNISFLLYYIQYENFEIPRCPICGKDTKHKTGLVFSTTCTSEKCIDELRKRYKHSEETKQKISRIRREYIKAHPESIISNYSPKESTGERIFREIFDREGIEYIQELKIHKYSLDFALFGRKIDFEVDGEQHYKDEDVMRVDRERTEYLRNNGWIIIRVR